MLRTVPQPLDSRHASIFPWHPQCSGTQNWAPLLRVFHNTNESGSVRHERELQGVMTSSAVHGLKDVWMSLNAHVTTMRRQDRQQDEEQKNYQKLLEKLIIRSPVHTQRRLTATLSPTDQRTESKGKMLASTRRDCCMRSPYTTFHRVQSAARQPNTHLDHVALTGM